MGWDWSHRMYKESVKDFLIRKLKNENNSIDAISVKGSVAFIAMRILKDNTIFGVVVILRSNNSAQHNQGYKIVTEDMGPYYTGCPKKIIDMLTPTDSPLSNEWRRACLEQRQPDYDSARRIYAEAN